jgi:hypothetical protein
MLTSRGGNRAQSRLEEFFKKMSKLFARIFPAGAFATGGTLLQSALDECSEAVSIGRTCRAEMAILIRMGKL